MCLNSEIVVIFLIDNSEYASLPAGPYPLDDLGHQHSALDALVKLGHLRLLQLVLS